MPFIATTKKVFIINTTQKTPKIGCVTDMHLLSRPQLFDYSSVASSSDEHTTTMPPTTSTTSRSSSLLAYVPPWARRYYRSGETLPLPAYSPISLTEPDSELLEPPASYAYPPAYQNHDEELGELPPYSVPLLSTKQKPLSSYSSRLAMERQVRSQARKARKARAPPKRKGWKVCLLMSLIWFVAFSFVGIVVGVPSGLAAWAHNRGNGGGNSDSWAGGGGGGYNDDDGDDGDDGDGGDGGDGGE